MIRPEVHQTGDLGELEAAKIFVRHGWIVEKLQSDYGFDLLIQRADGDKVVGDFVLVQVKATRKKLKFINGDEVSIRIGHSYLELWKTLVMPSYVMVINLGTGTAYLVDCQELAKSVQDAAVASGKKQSSYRMRIPSSARVDDRFMKNFSDVVESFWRGLRLYLRPGPGTGQMPGASYIPDIEFVPKRLRHLYISMFPKFSKVFIIYKLWWELSASAGRKFSDGVIRDLIK